MAGEPDRDETSDDPTARKSLQLKDGFVESKVGTEIIFFKKMRGIYAHAAFASTNGIRDPRSQSCECH